MKTKEIKKWLIDHEITQADVAKLAGVSPVAVHYFCKGTGISANIKSVFISLGCPRELLEKEAA